MELQTSADNRHLKWVVFAASVGVAAGLTYYAYCKFLAAQDQEEEEEEEEHKVVDVASPQTVTSRSLAKGDEPSSSDRAPTSPPTQTTPQPASPDADAPRACSHCHKATSVLMRCSQCKAVYYCSKACQRQAWPGHKTVCKKEDAEAKASQQADHDPRQSGFTRGIMEYLQQRVSAKTDDLEKCLENGVLRFVKQDFRDAITHFEETQKKAYEADNMGIVGETFKWLGHSYNRLANPDKSIEYFIKGVEHAKAHGDKRMEVDCLSGVGVVFRAINEVDEAVTYFQTALAITETFKDDESRASVLCNLGAALSMKDPKGAITYLEQAVALREQQMIMLQNNPDRGALGTAVMEHASAVVNLASAQYVVGNFAEACASYEQSLQVFELFEDHDKVTKVLLNMANMCELQNPDITGRKISASYRQRMLDYFKKHGMRMPPDDCPICLDPMHLTQVTTVGHEVIILGCLHCYHHNCWIRYLDAGAQPVCPYCKAIVPLYPRPGDVPAIAATASAADAVASRMSNQPHEAPSPTAAATTPNGVDSSPSEPVSATTAAAASVEAGPDTASPTTTAPSTTTTTTSSTKTAAATETAAEPPAAAAAPLTADHPPAAPAAVVDLAAASEDEVSEPPSPHIAADSVTTAAPQSSTSSEDNTTGTD